MYIDTLHTEEQLKITADFLSEIIQARRPWSNISEVLKGKKCESRILYLVKISFKNKGKRNTSMIK